MNKPILTLLVSLTLVGNTHADITSQAGGYALYDSVEDKTWIADANLAVTRSFGIAGIAANGSMTLNTANNWVNALNAALYLGYGDWRLPDTSPIDDIAHNQEATTNGSTDVGFNISAIGSVYSASPASEMANLFYTALSQIGIVDITGNITGCLASTLCLQNNLPFSNLQTSYYWSATSNPANANQNFFFHFGTGFQATHNITKSFHTIAMRNGDILDQDNDGLSDPRETLLGTDPLNVDSDNDGISDFDEVNVDANPDTYDLAIDTNPLQADTDNDSFSDGDEIDAGTNPLDPTDSPLLGDVNGDGDINTADLLLATQIILGTKSPTAAEAVRVDLAPRIDGVYTPDNLINAADLSLITQIIIAN